MKSEPALDELRAQIAKVTMQIIELAGKRNRLAGEVGRVKIQYSLPVQNEAIEDALTRDVIAECDKNGLDRRAGLKILSVLLSESKKAQGLPNRPPPAPIFAKALALQQKGVKLVRLDVGEPDFPPPRAVLKGCSDALFGFKTHYTESRGIPELREALRRYLARKFGFDAKDSEVTITPSGRFAVYAALAGVVGEGESVVVIDPNWPAYKDALWQLGAKPLVVNARLENQWTPSIKEIEEAIRPHTKAVILSFPNNPTGSIVSSQLFREIVELADERGLTVISDEIYNEYSFKPCPSILKTTPKKFVLTSSFSKTWAMTGFRIGYAVSAPTPTANISKLVSLMVTSVPEFIQWGAIEALGADADVKSNVAEMKDRIEIASRELDRIGALEYFKPDGAMYVFPRIGKPPESGDSFSEKLLERGVSVAPGSVFGDYRDFIRISLGQPREQIVEGIRRMGELLA
ncbi:MAG: aminotransferase class I/II-fold pyridoxal phosphate-dependent enzyme [Nitrososphaerales archaeon]|nr:aminotransferase class I/II-fold pyridoxal phosphate-dependent enzyme [Nitrososphaerales archaeon]